MLSNTLGRRVDFEDSDEAGIVKEDPDDTALNLARITAGIDVETETEDHETVETVVKSKRKRGSGTQPKRSKARLPDDTMYDLFQDANGQWYNRWAHITVFVRRLWDPELAKPDEPLPAKSRVDDTTYVTEESNQRSSPLNVE